MDPSSSTLPDSAHPCAIAGQSDIYGLGIRISLYLQWYAGILAYVYSRSQAHLPITTNYLIAIAVGIACMVHHDDIYSLEIMIVAILMMVPPLALLMVLGEFLLFMWIHRKTKRDPEDVVKMDYPFISIISHIGVLLSTAFLLGVMVWGFFYGPDVMKKADGCTPMFADSKYLAGTYSTGLRIWSVALIIFAISTIIFFMGFRGRLSRARGANDTFTRLVDEFIKMEFEQGPLNTGRLVKFFRPAAVVFCGGVVSTCIMTIELVIYQNDIQGVGDVTSAGQLIPLMIGLASFGLMIFERYTDGKEEEPPNPKLAVGDAEAGVAPKAPNVQAQGTAGNSVQGS